MVVKSEVISVRLHPDNPREREALQAFRQWQQQGYTPREIITDAILARAGFKPEMFDESGLLTRATMENLLTDFASHIVEQFKQRQADTPPTEATGDDTDADYMQNLAQGYLKRKGH